MSAALSRRNVLVGLDLDDTLLDPKRALLTAAFIVIQRRFSQLNIGPDSASSIARQWLEEMQVTWKQRDTAYFRLDRQWGFSAHEAVVGPGSCQTHIAAFVCAI